ncbi:MAG: flagellar biosynthesis anti-sigma factor FlgM [Pseudomonadota bacterium]
MSNDIDGIAKTGLNKIGDVTSGRRVDSDKPQTSERQSSQTARPDTVALTDGARLLERVEAELNAASDVDVKRIDAIKAEIANGNYQIDDRVIAERILRSDQERG